MARKHLVYLVMYNNHHSWLHTLKVSSLSILISLADGFKFWLDSMAHPNPEKYLISSKNYHIYLLSARMECWKEFQCFSLVFRKIRRKLPYTSMRKFNTFIEKTALIDLPLHNGHFTWSNLRESPTPHSHPYWYIFSIRKYHQKFVKW